MIKAGLTGGIGSGKTTVAHIFESLNVPVYNSDERARYLMNHDIKLIQLIKKRFGENAYTLDGTLNRSFIAEIVFNDKSQLEWLNNMVHPSVGTDFKYWLSKQSAKLIIKESALLIETLSMQNLDKIIVVISEESQRIQRIKERDKMPTEMILKRMNAQISDEERIKYADFIIENDGRHSLIQQCLKIYKQLMSY